MIEEQATLLQEHADWRRVLEEYATSSAPVAEDGREDPWHPRLATLDGIESGKLASIHGQLIAFGMLRFEIRDRSGGLVYRPSTDGMAALHRIDGPHTGEISNSRPEPEIDEPLGDDVAA